MDVDATKTALAGLGPLPSGVRRWEPPADLADHILAARRNGASYNSIAETLQRNGVSASFGSVRTWLQRQGL